jgi:hypothetical protein
MPKRSRGPGRFASAISKVFLHLFVNLFHALAAQFIFSRWGISPSPLGTTNHSIFNRIDNFLSLSSVPYRSLIEVCLTGYGFDLVGLVLGASIWERLFFPLLFLDPFFVGCLEHSSPVEFYRESWLVLAAFAGVLLKKQLGYLFACLFSVIAIASRIEFQGLVPLFLFHGLVGWMWSEHHGISGLIYSGIIGLAVVLFWFCLSNGVIDPIAPDWVRVNRTVLTRLVETDTFGLFSAYVILVPISAFTGEWPSDLPIFLIVLLSLDLPWLSAVGQEYSSVVVIRLLVYVGLSQIIATQRLEKVEPDIVPIDGQRPSTSISGPFPARGSRTWYLKVAFIALVVTNAIVWALSPIRTFALAQVKNARIAYYGVA